MTDDERWGLIPRSKKYLLAGKRYTEVKRGERGVLVALADISDEELAEIAAQNKSDNKTEIT